MRTLTIKFGSVGLAIYLAIGILYHLLTSDIPFTWADPWLYITMAIWPIFVITWIIVIFIVCFLFFVAFKMYEGRKHDNKMKKIRVEREERRRAAAKATPSE